MAKKNEYFEGVGRRKTAIARVRIVESGKDRSFFINDKEPSVFLDTQELISIINSPLVATATEEKFAITAKVRGGGKKGQAGAIQLALSRALVKFDIEFQRTLRDLDYLKRDPRKKERKKPGLKKARKSPQWSKR
ncbi:MAG: 30S ribosomal protein S9 [Patescibacteria group bacterium]|nr:30S ribosomal protein S9 [Patescibacteria group bacterium]